jgi:ATP-dependent Clp protease ATP-binding subunit ClpC
VQHEVEDLLSEKILHGELNSGDHVHVDFIDGKFVFTTTQRAVSATSNVNAGAALGTGPVTPGIAIAG